MIEKDAALKNPLVLAFVGDAVMTLRVRERLSGEYDGKVGELHKLAARKICATAQAARFDKLFDTFEEAEKDIAMRARNVKHHTVPKNAKLSDYIKATALEAVVGYNYLIGNSKRVDELIDC